jgi:hypothetical protein
MLRKPTKVDSGYTGSVRGRSASRLPDCEAMVVPRDISHVPRVALPCPCKL